MSCLPCVSATSLVLSPLPATPFSPVTLLQVLACFSNFTNISILLHPLLLPNSILYVSLSHLYFMFLYPCQSLCSYCFHLLSAHLPCFSISFCYAPACPTFLPSSQRYSSPIYIQMRKCPPCYLGASRDSTGERVFLFSGLQ